MSEDEKQLLADALNLLEEAGLQPDLWQFTGDGEYSISLIGLTQHPLRYTLNGWVVEGE